MRIVVMSDIHANFEALQGVLADTARLSVDRYVCLGDVVGYYARPQECVDLVRRLDMLCVQGNHDAVAGGVVEPHGFNQIATDAILWTREQLDEDSRAWLAELPTQIPATPTIWAVHGSLRDRDEYLLNTAAIRENFDLMRSLRQPRAVFFGHTHRRAVYRFNAEDRVEMCAAEKDLALEPDKLFLINPGGAGQPRDGVPGAPYAIVEDDVVRFRRAKYDVDAAADRVAALPFGKLLAERLRRGV